MRIAPVPDPVDSEPVQIESVIVPFRIERPPKSSEIAPNELYAKIERKINEVSEPEPEGARIPVKVQLA